MRACESNPLLPPELLLNILDQLVENIHGKRYIALDPSSAATNTLRSLTLVSRFMYPIATSYLYSRCLYVNNSTNYARLRRTLGLPLGSHPQSLPFGQALRYGDVSSNISRHVSSVFISPVRSDSDHSLTPMVRLPQIIDLFKMIGKTLKRLALDLQPVYAPGTEIAAVKPYLKHNNIFLDMLNLEELIVSYDVVDYFSHPPPNLRRLAITEQQLEDIFLQFCFSTSSLEQLVLLRPPELLSTDIDDLFDAYKGKSLDIILVDVNPNHRTPLGTRPWSNEDTIRIWEADVPTSFYGDEDNLVLCDNWIWRHGVDGTLWTEPKRRMTSWDEVHNKLTGPVHTILNSLQV